MTNEQAYELLNHLIDQLERNGYGEIVRQAKIRLEESYETNSSLADDFSFRSQLMFYIDTSIDTLENMSSANLEQSINTMNEFLKENFVNTIQVKLIDDEYFDLQNLPNYSPVIGMLQEVRNQLNNE